MVVTVSLTHAVCYIDFPFTFFQISTNVFRTLISVVVINVLILLVVIAAKQSVHMAIIWKSLVSALVRLAFEFLIQF